MVRLHLLHRFALLHVTLGVYHLLTAMIGLSIGMARKSVMSLISTEEERMEVELASIWMYDLPWTVFRLW